MKLLDIFKFNQNFSNLKLKALLEKQLDFKQNERLNDSEEEELKSLSL